MVMFIGEYRHNLDAKNRLIIPAKFRDQLSTTVYVTEWLDGCLGVYDENGWQKLLEGMNQYSKTSANARAYVRRISAKADECTIDGQGRILLPQFLLNDREIKKNCVVAGASDHFEIWSEEKYDDYMNAAGDNLESIAESLPQTNL